MTQHIGEKFGHYRLIRFLGEGTFGDVYYGEHVSKKTPAAIKVFKNKLTPDKFRSFINEVRTVLLKHPNIVEILDFGIGDNELPYLVMEYAPNGTLLQSHPRGIPSPIATAVSYVKQLAAALQYAHDQGIIHRDVKPENMLFGPDYDLLLSDFGLAVVVHSTLSRPTEDKSGTALYMAPEHWKGKPLPATDQYALGMVVYEWLCGEHPFSGGTLQLMYQHIHISPPPLRDKLPTISTEVDQVVMTALAKEPSQRFKRVQAFAVALEEASKSKPVIILPPPLAAPEQSIQHADGPVAVDPEPSAKQSLDSESARSATPSTPGIKEDFVLPLDPPESPMENVPSSGHVAVPVDAVNVPHGGSRFHPGSSDLPGKQPRIINDLPKAAPVPPIMSPPQPSPVSRTPRQQNDAKAAAASAGKVAGGILASRIATGGGASQGPRRFSWPIMLVLLLLLALLLCSGVAFALPKQTQAVTSTVSEMVSNLVHPQFSTVTITPASQLVQNSYSVQAVTSGASAIQHQVTAHLVSYTTPAQQKTATATGHTQTPGVQATGSLTFFNNGSSSSYTVAAGTIFTDANGVQVVKNVPAVIPAAPRNGQGQVTVAAHALSVGTAGNIPADNINILPCCGSSSVSVSNTTAFTGGQDAHNYSFLQQGDIDSVATPLKESLLPKAQNGLKSQFRSSEQPVGSPQCSPKVSSDQVVGDSGVNIASATVRASVTCTQEVYDQQGLQTLVEGLLKAKVSADPTLAGFALVGSIVTDTKLQGVDNNGMVTLAVTAKGKWVYPLDAKALARLIKGLSAEQAKAKLMSQPGVADVGLPAGITTFSRDSAQITITILSVTGFPGGGRVPTTTPSMGTPPGSPTAQSGGS